MSGRKKSRWRLLFVIFVLFGAALLWQGEVPTRRVQIEICLLQSKKTESVQTDAWWAQLRESLPGDVADAVAGVESGETEVGFSYLFSVLWQGVKGGVGIFRRVFFTLLGVVLLSAVATLVAGDSAALKKPMGFLMSAVCAISLWQVTSGCGEVVNAFLKDLTSFSEGLAPVMAGILAGGGGAGASVATASGFATLMAVLEIVSGRVLAPLITICFAFSLVGAVSGDMRLDGITKNLKSLFLTLLGVVGVLAAGGFALQNIIAVASDTMAMRTARYTVGNMIPIIGGTIGAALGTIGSSLSVVKSTIGAGSVVACLMLLLPPLVALFLTRLAMNLVAGAARMVGFDTGEKLLTEFRGIFDMALALTALAGTVFLIYIAIFLKTALPFAT